MFDNKTVLKIISLLAALFLWIYVMGEVDPETREKIGGIPVSLANTEVLAESGLAAFYDEEVKISATISGKASDVNAAKRNGLTAFVDVSECDKGKNEEKIIINLPDGLTVENASKTTLVITVEEIEYKTVPVEIELPTAELGMDTVPWLFDQYPETVEVSGVKSSVDKVKSVRGVVEGELPTKSSDSMKIPLEPVNKKGKKVLGIKIDVDSAEVEVQLLYDKLVELEIEDGRDDANKAKNSNSEQRAKAEIPTNIRIVGEKEDLKAIDTVKGTAYIDENGRTNVSVELPENIFLLIGENDGKIIWN